VDQNLFGMRSDPLSPELALVDPELGARARAALPAQPWPAPTRRAPMPAAPVAPVSAEHVEGHRAYPFWARATAALWLVVIGILIGGAAIPHAQDRPRVVPPEEDVPASICQRPQPATSPSTALP
jgi:hypothetical protein